MKRFLRRLSLWKNRFRKGPIYGLNGWDLIRISKKNTTVPLKGIPKEEWTTAIAEVPIPKRGFDCNLDLNALLALARRRI